MQNLDPTTPSFWLAIGVTVLCGAIVGLDRRVRGKVVGVRTSILICLSTHIFIRVSLFAAGPQTDPTRVLGQVVTGVGFLGAGVILSRGQMVTGVTTAAVIWVLAAIGATVAFHRFGTAIALALITVAILNGVDRMEAAVQRFRGGPRSEVAD